MEPSGISALGSDARVLVLQVINFAILFGLLRWFAYKPVIALLDARRKKIEEGLAAAERSIAQVAEMKEKEKNILDHAREEAHLTITAAKAQVQELRESEKAKLEQELGKVAQRHMEQLQAEHERIRTQFKQSLGVLVVRATEKVIEQKIDPEWTEKAAQKAVKELV